MKKREKIDFILILLWPVFAAVLSIIFDANYVISQLLFFGVPSIYLSIKDKKLIKKVVLFSIFFSIPLTFVIDYVAHLTGTWHITFSYFPKLLGFIVMENFLFVFLWFYFVIIYYEYFLEHKFKDKLIYPQLKYAIIILFSLIFIFLAVLFSNPQLLFVKYFYFWGGVIFAIIPIVGVLLEFPNLFVKFFKAGAYFFYFAFIYEVTALKLNQWTFPGDYFIGWIKVFGTKLPFEEIFFSLLIGSIAILSYYEFFDEPNQPK